MPRFANAAKCDNFFSLKCNPADLKFHRFSNDIFPHRLILALFFIFYVLTQCQKVAQNYHKTKERKVFLLNLSGLRFLKEFDD